LSNFIDNHFGEIVTLITVGLGALFGLGAILWRKQIKTELALSDIEYLKNRPDIKQLRDVVNEIKQDEKEMFAKLEQLIKESDQKGNAAHDKIWAKVAHLETSFERRTSALEAKIDMIPKSKTD